MLLETPLRTILKPSHPIGPEMCLSKWAAYPSVPSRAGCHCGGADKTDGSTREGLERLTNYSRWASTVARLTSLDQTTMEEEKRQA